MPYLTFFEAFRNVFTAPSFQHFTVLMISLWALPLVTGGPVSLARIWSESRLSRHWDALMRFVRRYAWSQAKLSETLLQLILETVSDRLPTAPDGRALLLVGVDETTDDHHTAKKIFGVSKHFNHTAKPGQSRYKIGHCWVTLFVLTDVFSDYVRSFAFNIALYIGRKSCQKKQYQSKRELATQMLDEMAQWVGTRYQIVVVGDAYYAARNWIAEQRQLGRRVITRIRCDSDLRDLPPARKPGRRGRPPLFGPRIYLSRRSRCLHRFEPRYEASVYGQKHSVRLRKLVCFWHGLPQPVSVVIVRGIGKKPFYLLDTDASAEAKQTLQFYAARHAVEQPFEDLKCDGGLGHYRGRTERGVRRFAQLAITAHTLLRLIEVNKEISISLPLLQEPWRAPLSHLTVGQIRRSVARLLLDAYARTGHFFTVDAQRQNARNSQRTAAILEMAA